MSVTIAHSLPLGPAYAGLASSLRAQLYDIAGVASGGEVSTGFVELGSDGAYQFTHAYADGFAGSVRVYLSGSATTLGVAGVDVRAAGDLAALQTTAASVDGKLPADTTTKLARLDAAVSTRATPGDVDGASTGDGDVAVDHNNQGQRITRDGVGIDNAIIRAYLSTDYAAGAMRVRGRTYTNAAGEWVAPLMLNVGDYKVSVYDPATGTTKLFDLTVEAD